MFICSQCQVKRAGRVPKSGVCRICNPKRAFSKKRRGSKRSPFNSVPVPLPDISNWDLTHVSLSDDETFPDDDLKEFTGENLDVRDALKPESNVVPRAVKHLPDDSHSKLSVYVTLPQKLNRTFFIELIRVLREDGEVYFIDNPCKPAE